jgi:predicted nucleic-acid-binding protein
MIAADTNLLVRHLTEDDPAQTRRVRAWLSEAEASRQNIFVSLVVVAELCWVLKSVYQFDREGIEHGLRELLQDGQFLFEARPMVEQATEAFAHSAADFPDHLIGLLANGAGAVTTYTFDKKAAKLPGFALLK